MAWDIFESTFIRHTVIDAARIVSELGVGVGVEFNAPPDTIWVISEYI